jgi:hypothetical protein
LCPAPWTTEREVLKERCVSPGLRKSLSRGFCYVLMNLE